MDLRIGEPNVTADSPAPSTGSSTQEYIQHEPNAIHIAELRRSIVSLWAYVVTVAALIFVLVLARRLPADYFSSGVSGYQIPELALYLLPLVVTLLGLRRLFNCRYSVLETEIIARQGILSFKYEVTRVRFTQIRYTRACQSIFQRFWGYGDLCLFTTNHDCPDLKFYGIRNPQAAAEKINQLQEKTGKISPFRKGETAESRGEIAL